MKSLAFLLLLLVPLIWAAGDVFEADDEILKNEGKANIEQFWSIKNVSSSVKNQDELTLSTLLFTPDGIQDIDGFYSVAITNLRQYSPKLRILNLFGGHTFYPEESNPEVIREEIIFAKDHLQSLLRAMKKEGISLGSNLLTILMVVDDKSQKESDFEDIVGKQFGREAIVDDTNEDGLELLFKMDDSDIHLYLVFVNNLDAVRKTKLPFGRTAYARSITEFLEPIYEELQEQSKKRIKSDDTKLFVPGVRRLNEAGELHLEEFYDEKFVDPKIKDFNTQEMLEQLVLSVGVPELKNVGPEEFYATAVKNLLKYAPNLKVVRIDGGYTYNPREINPDTIKDEISFFHDNLAAVLKAFKDNGITVSSLKLKVFWLSSKKDAEDSGYPALIKSTFGYEPTEADIDQGKVLMSFRMADVNALVDLHFFDQAPKELPFGRANYYTALKLHEEAQGKGEGKEEQKKSSESSEEKQ